MHEAEVLYFLALLEGKADNPYQKQLIERYPSSVFTKQLASGLVERTADIEERAASAYKQLLLRYDSGDFAEGAQLADQAYYQFIGTQWQDRIAYLRMLFLSKGTQVETYKTALQEFVANHPNSTFLTDIKARQKVVTP